MIAGSNALWVGAALVAASLGLLAWVLLAPSSAVAVERRRHGVEASADGLTQFSAATTERLGVLLQRTSNSQRWAYTLDRAGIRLSLAEFIVAVTGGLLGAAALGTVLGGPFTGILLALLAVGGVIVVVMLRADRRKAAFADMLEDLVQLMATNLRAGHSVLQALDSIAQEMEDPTRTEVARVVNEVRLGRDLAGALVEVADRMESEDFRWVAQAIAIHRQVGGNLADVLDTVAATIRERNQIRRQVRALSAEGRMSAWILLGLPVFMAFAMSVLNPSYIGVLFTRAIGWLLVVGAIVLMMLGALWLRKIVQVKF